MLFFKLKRLLLNFSYILKFNLLISIFSESYNLIFIKIYFKQHSICIYNKNVKNFIKNIAKRALNILNMQKLNIPTYFQLTLLRYAQIIIFNTLHLFTHIKIFNSKLVIKFEEFKNDSLQNVKKILNPHVQCLLGKWTKICKKKQFTCIIQYLKRDRNIFSWNKIPLISFETPKSINKTCYSF